MEPWPEVAVLRMGGIETDRQAKRGAGRVGLDKFNRGIAAQFGFVAQTAIRHFLKVGIPVDRLEKVKPLVNPRLAALHSIFSGKPSAVARRFQQNGIARGDMFRGNRRFAKIIAMGSLRKPGEDGGAACGANRHLAKGIFKANPFGGQPVERRGLHNGMPVAPQHSVALVVRQKKYNIAPLRSGRETPRRCCNDAQQRQCPFKRGSVHIPSQRNARTSAS